MTDFLLRFTAGLGNWACAVVCASLAYLVARDNGNALVVGVLAVGAVHFATQETP